MSYNEKVLSCTEVFFDKTDIPHPSSMILLINEINKKCCTIRDFCFLKLLGFRFEFDKLILTV